MGRRKKIAADSRKPGRIGSHAKPYITVADLASYWAVSPKQIYKQIDDGALRAIRLGPRLVRIRTSDACAFEKRREWSLMTLEGTQGDSRRADVGTHS